MRVACVRAVLHERYMRVHALDYHFGARSACICILQQHQHARVAMVSHRWLRGTPRGWLSPWRSIVYARCMQVVLTTSSRAQSLRTLPSTHRLVATRVRLGRSRASSTAPARSLPLLVSCSLARCRCLCMPEWPLADGVGLPSLALFSPSTYSPALPMLT